MESLKHECGVAMIRLLKPLEYYKEKYGTSSYGLNKLYLLMEKQHNRGQEGAGVGVVKINPIPGHEYVFRERALGTNAITEIFDKIMSRLDNNKIKINRNEEPQTPFIGEIYMGHLRYSTTGRSGLSYVHPFLRRNNWRSRNLMICGNFNMTNVDELFKDVVNKGQHPRLYSDTIILLEQLGHALDKENHRLYREYRNISQGIELAIKIEDSLNISNILNETSPKWDGGFVICGATGSGDMFAIRDSHGIRPAYYYTDDEIVVVASERPVIQTVLNVRHSEVKELIPGNALIVSKNGLIQSKKILPESEIHKCSFERIYFSRGSDRDIYAERKALGKNLVPKIISTLGGKLADSVFSFIPNTAEVAFIGMIEGLEKYLDEKKSRDIINLSRQGSIDPKSIDAIMGQKIRVEKIAIKDIKLRTFITEGSARNDLAAHVYDVTYGIIRNNVDTLIVIDDSIVRGTTLRQSIIKMLDRLHPAEIIIVSSSPQVRYPDYYGIDMSRIGEFIAFKAAVNLLKKRGLESVLDKTYHDCKAMEHTRAEIQENCVKQIYERFSDDEISEEIAQMLTPTGIKAKIKIIYQSLSGLSDAIPNHTGDWYFSGNYPTTGGIRLVNKAYINYYEGNPDKR